LWADTDISEEHVAFTFRAEVHEQASDERNLTQGNENKWTEGTLAYCHRWEMELSRNPQPFSREKWNYMRNGQKMSLFRATLKFFSKEGNLN
jgi:hypothetical protein